MLSVFVSLFLAAQTVQAAPKLVLTGEIAAVDGLDLCFESGLRVAYMVDPSHPTVTITSVVGSGGTADPDAKEGLAHLVEHLWFRSAQEGYPDVQVATDELGAWANASTTLDDTTYKTVGPASEVDTLLALEVARLQNPMQGISQSILDTEREVVRNELRERYENSSAVGLSELRQRVFPADHPYNRSIAGSHETLDHLTLDDVQAFSAAHYTPSNTTWLITGPWTRSKFSQVLGASLPEGLLIDADGEDYPLGGAPCPERLPSPEVFDFKPDRAAVTIEAGVTQPLGLFGWAMPSGFSDAHAQTERAMWSLEWALDDWGASCSLSEARDASLGTCAIPLGHVRVAEREPYLRDALDQIAYLWDRHYLLFQDRTYRSTVGDQLGWVYSALETETAYHPGARDLHHTGRFDTLFEYMRQLNASVQARDASFMETWINQRRAATVILVPRSDDGPGGVNRHAETVKAPTGVADGEIDDSEIEAATHVPNLDKLHSFELSNGLNVWILPMKGPPFAHVSLIMEGNLDSAPSAAVDRLRDIFHEDVHDTIVQEEKLSLAPERIGGSWFTGASRTTTTRGIRGASGNLDGLLYLLRMRVDRSRVSLDSRRNVYLALDERKWVDRDYVETWETQLFDGHLGRPSTVLDEDFIAQMKAVGAGEASQWNKRIYSPIGATLIIAGRVDVQKADKLVRNHFADWRDRGDGQAPAVRDLPRPASNPRRVVLLNDAQRTNADIHAACLLPEITEENGEVREVIGAGLEASLWRALRTEQGATYGVHGWTVRESNGLASLHVQTDVQADAAAEAVEAIFGGIEAMEAGVTEEEVQQWKLLLARKSVLGQRTYSEIRRELEWAAISGMGLDGLEGYPERLASVRQADMGVQLQGCSGAELVTVTGPVETLASQLDAAEIPYEVLDWETIRDEKMAELAPRRWKREQRERRLR